MDRIERTYERLMSRLEKCTEDVIRDKEYDESIMNTKDIYYNCNFVTSVVIEGRYINCVFNNCMISNKVIISNSQLIDCITTDKI